jgi:hypothetical protein
MNTFKALITGTRRIVLNRQATGAGEAKATTTTTTATFITTFLNEASIVSAHRAVSLVKAQQAAGGCISSK